MSSITAKPRKIERPAKTRTISATELRIGDVIVGRWADGYIKTTETKVTKIGSCCHSWRTHIHVNRMQCWDTRTLVEVKA